MIEIATIVNVTIAVVAADIIVEGLKYFFNLYTESLYSKPPRQPDFYQDREPGF